METSRRLWKLETPEGTEVCKYALRGTRGEWLGDVTLEYSAAQHQLEMHVISDFGNYGCRWDGAGDKGYAHFLLRAGTEYIAGKLADGHDERRVLDEDKTREEIWRRFYKRNGGEDADWLGECRCELDGCEAEADFYRWADAHGYEDVFEDFYHTMGGYLPGMAARLLPELKRVLREEETERQIAGTRSEELHEAIQSIYTR